MSRLHSALFALLLLLAAPARAYTPDPGMWWNPAEPGVGYTFDLQDNYMGMTLYMYTPDGHPDWYIAVGFLQGNALFEAPVLRFEDGMCFGCSWRRNAFDREMGDVRVVFDPDDPTRASMTLGGRTFPIERYHFYLKRPEDGSAPTRLTKMLGEWSMTIDWSEAVSGDDYPYSGDILVLDLVDMSEVPGYVDGCRPDNGVDGFCSERALDLHASSGFFDVADQRHVIVVDDSEHFWAQYVLQVTTDDVRGEMSIYRKGDDPSQWFPVRGFRTASRTFVEEGIGPASAKRGMPGRRSGADGGLASRLPDAASKANDAGSGLQPAMDAQRLDAIRHTLEQRILRAQ